MEESNYLKKLSGITHCAAVSGLMSLLISVYQAKSLKGHFTVILCRKDARLGSSKEDARCLLALEYSCELS